MIPVDSGHPGGTIAVVTGELMRYTDFVGSMDTLRAPRNTAIARVNGPSVARNRNDIVHHMFHGEWVCFLDDDQVVKPDTLMRLLSHEKDIVGSLYSTKRPPFVPIVFKDTGQYEFDNYAWRDLPPDGGLFGPVRATGTGGMLIRRKVFETIPAPWFNAMEFTDDLFFCEKARAHGFDIFVDLDAPIGHTTSCNVWPAHQGRLWGVNVNLMELSVSMIDDGAEPAAADPPRIIIPGA